MQSSKYVRIDNNVLLEYIYDDGNLISEPYSVYINSNTNVRGFLSTLEETSNYFVKKDVLVSGSKNPQIITNQLVKLDEVSEQWGRLALNTYSFVSKVDFGISAPIRYDKLKIWIPVNWTFGDYKGFHIRIYTLDFNNENWVDLSNYYFDITDVNQSRDIQYSSQILVQYQTPWGKFFEIQFPSPNKVSDQRRNNVTRENTINFNLTNGIGISKDSPVFVDFYFIKNITKSNKVSFYNLVEKQSVSFPKTSEVEKFSITVEPSLQGDFFLIYPEYNGSIGEFNQFITDSLTRGNRYYLEWIIEIFEKNIKVDEQKLIITENFIEEIEFRPIFKFTTTTAIIDVTAKLIDAVDNSVIERKASYGLLQDSVSNYSRYLSKIDLTKSEAITVYKIKSVQAPNLDSSGVQQSTLNIRTIPYIAYSRNYFINTSNSNVNLFNENWLGDRKLTISITPYDNVFKFSIISKNSTSNFDVFNLSSWSDLLLTFKSDNKTIDFDLWEDSDSNNLELGNLVFKINSDKIETIKKISNDGFRNFYISGSDSGLKKIIYTGLFTIWDSESNLNSLENLFQISRNTLEPTEVIEKNNFSELNKIELVKQTLINETNLDTSVTRLNSEKPIDIKKNPLTFDISPLNSIVKLESQIYRLWQPYWLGSFDIMLKSWGYSFENNMSLTNQFNSWQTPSNLRLFGIQLKERGIINEFNLDKRSGAVDALSARNVDLILGYFKINNFNPNDIGIIDYLSQNKSDLTNYLSSKESIASNELIARSNTPPNREVYELIESLVSKKRSISTNTKFKKIQSLFDARQKNIE
jgi:hypothetical protein